MIVLAGDVGGTNTRLALFSVENRNFEQLAFERYDNKQFENLEEILQTFLKTSDAHPRAAAFGIAGPVIDGVCKATNLPWTIDVAKLSKATGIARITLVNDFVAHAHGIDALHPKDLDALQRGDHEGMANRALIGPGTGLGEAIVAQHGGDSLVVASEGGHQDFAPQNEPETALMEYLRARFGHVSNERILSGPGVLNIYDFMKKTKRGKESPLLQKLLSAKGADKPAIILRNAPKDRLCALTADLFFSVLGAEAGNLALQSLSFGGVYLVGGIARSNLEVLKKSQFMQRFRNKGRMSNLMKQMPVYVVKNEQLGILGAAALASELF